MNDCCTTCPLTLPLRCYTCCFSRRVTLRTFLFILHVWKTNSRWAQALEAYEEENDDSDQLLSSGTILVFFFFIVPRSWSCCQSFGLFILSLLRFTLSHDSYWRDHHNPFYCFSKRHAWIVEQESETEETMCAVIILESYDLSFFLLFFFTIPGLRRAPIPQRNARHSFWYCFLLMRANSCGQEGCLLPPGNVFFFLFLFF